MKPIISIIISMHNAETVIERCLDSLCDQTIKNLEIIVIDDNSDDNSYEKASVYKSKCSKFLLLQNSERIDFRALKYNGLRHATADIIGFLDAGDHVEKTYYEKMLNAIKKADADIVCGDVIASGRHPEGDFLDKKQTIKNDEEPIIINPVSAASDKNAPFMIAKLFRKSIVSTYSENVHDDISFAFMAFAKAKKIVYTPHNYYYRTNISIGHVGASLVSVEMAECLSKTATKILSDEKIHSELVKVMYGQNIWLILSDILSNQDNRERWLEECYNNLKFIEVLENNSYLDNYISVKSWGEQRFILNLVRLFINKEFNKMTQLFDQYGYAPYYYLPRVSIVIPVYNGSNYLEAAIESALMQKYPDLEVIVVNDGSQDNGATENIARSFGDRIKYYYKDNGGVASALNYGIEHMTGEYFSWLSHDDLYKNNKILKQIEALQNLEDKRTIVVCGYELVNENLEKLYDVNLRDIYTKEEVEKPLFAVFRGGINGCGTLIHKSHFERVGMFNIDLLTTQDYDLWFRIMRGQKICYLAENYVLSRSHEAQDSKKLFDKHIMECNQLWINLLEQLCDEEKKIISGTLLQFYYDEKKFFETLPYAEVVNYLEVKLLDLLKESLKRKEPIDFELLCKLICVKEENVKLNHLIETISNNVKKCAIILSDNTYSDIGIQKTLWEMKTCMSDFRLFYVILSEKKQELEWIKNNSIMFISEKNIIALPKLLKLINVDMCVISDDECVQYSMYSKFTSIGIRTVAWKTKKHWIFDNKNLMKSCVEQITISSNVDLTIWIDSESALIDSQINKNVVHIPLISQNEDNKDTVKQSWMWVFLNEYGKMKNDIYECDSEIMKIMIKKYEEVIIEKSNEILLSTDKNVVQYKSDDDNWEERYYNVINSTSWKLTRPIRKLVDKVRDMKFREGIK